VSRGARAVPAQHFHFTVTAASAPNAAACTDPRQPPTLLPAGPHGSGGGTNGGERALTASWALRPLESGGGAHGVSAFQGAGWPSVQVAALETLRVAAAGAGDAANAWHACASTLRHHHSGLPPAAQVGLLSVTVGYFGVTYLSYYSGVPSAWHARGVRVDAASPPVVSLAMPPCRRIPLRHEIGQIGARAAG
jgi:hypothetical protein